MDPNTTPIPLGDDFYESVKPLAWDDPNNDYALKTLCYAIAQMFAEAELYGRADEDGNPGWSILFDLDRVPYEAIPYLAQYVGQTIPSGLDDTDARELVRSPNNQERGTVASIIAAAESVLTGTKTVLLQERVNGDAYKLRVVTQTSESPSSAVLRAAIEKVKPAGIVLEIVITDSTIIDALSGTIDSQTAIIDAL